MLFTSWVRRWVDWINFRGATSPRCYSPVEPTITTSREQAATESRVKSHEAKGQVMDSRDSWDSWVSQLEKHHKQRERDF